MKVLHKLFAGILLVALAVFGMTALSSSSSDDTRVWGFTNDTCDSDWSMFFESLADMIDYDGTTDDWGITWNFGSYHKFSELLYEETYECYEFDASAEEEVEGETEAQPEPTPNPGGHRGGGDDRGGHQGGHQGGGGGPVRGNPPPPQCVFDDEDLENLNKCWKKKVKDLLESTENRLRKDRKKLNDYIANADKQYTWATSTEDSAGIGYIDWADKEITIYPQGALRFSYAQCEHVIAQGVLQEYYHAIQAKNATWTKGPKPYELYDIEVKAHEVSYKWYNPIFGFGAPIADFLESEKTKPTEFEANKEKYQDIEDAIADGTVTDAQRTELQNLKLWFKSNLPHTDKRGGLYELSGDLGCD